MKKLLTIAVLATLSTMTYAADKVIDTDIVSVKAPPVQQLLSQQANLALRSSD